MLLRTDTRPCLEFNTLESAGLGKTLRWITINMENPATVSMASEKQAPIIFIASKVSYIKSLLWVLIYSFINSSIHPTDYATTDMNLVLIKWCFSKLIFLHLHWLLRLHFKPHHLARLTLGTGTISTVISNNSFGNCFPLWDTNVRFLIWPPKSDFLFWTLDSDFLFWTTVTDFSFWTQVSEFCFGHQCLIFDLRSLNTNVWFLIFWQ